MAPEQLFFFAIFLMLALFNLFARWIRGRMGQRPAEPEERQGPPREEPGYEIREMPAPREMPPPREVPPPREMPRRGDFPPLRQTPPPRETSRPPEPHRLPPRARPRRPVSLEEMAARSPMSLEETGPAATRIAAAPRSATVHRPRSRLRLGDRAELRRAILLRTILGPPRGMEDGEREV